MEMNWLALKDIMAITLICLVVALLLLGFLSDDDNNETDDTDEGEQI